MPDVNLNPFTAESAAIQRRLQMAQALGQQALQPMDLPQQAGVRASPYAGLAKILQAYNAAQAEKSATQEYKDLAERYQAGNRAEMGSFLEAMQGAPERAPRLDPQEVQQMADQGTPMPPNIPAIAPDRQRAMALALGSQNPTLQGAGGALLSQMFAQDKIKDFKVELVGDKTHRIGYTETGKRIDLGPITESVSPDTAARLKQDKEQADRAFSQLSASQKATLANDAARLNISAQQLFFDTGIKAGGGSFVNPLAQPPAPTAQSAPNAPPVVPTQPNAQRPPVAGAVPTSAPPPVAGAPSAYTPLSQLSPKAQQQMAMEAMQAQQKKERGMQGIGETIDQAKNILQGKTFNEKAEPFGEPPNMPETKSCATPP